MIQIKKKDKLIPSHSSFCGLKTSDWEKLNNGKTVELKKIPELAKQYIVEVKHGKS